MNVITQPMYHVHIPTRREKKTWLPKVYTPSSRTDTFNKTKLLPAQEYHRRDNIIRDHYIKCPVHVGETVVPTDTQDEKWRKKGAYFVKHIDHDWNEYCGSEKDELKVDWPKDDKPYIVHAVVVETGEPVVTKYNFFRSARPDEL